MQYRETLMNGQHTKSPQTFFENNLTEWSPDFFFYHLIMVSVLGEQNATSQAHVQVKCVSVIVFVEAAL